MRRLRDDPQCADEEFAALGTEDPGLGAPLSFDPEEDIAAPYLRGARPRLRSCASRASTARPRMAAVFDRAGFTSTRHPHDGPAERACTLAEFKGVVACGGFSYGDVLGAGEGWAKSILFHARSARSSALSSPATTAFAFGICNGCQMFAALKSIIPGTEHWPRFVRTACEQYEARSRWSRC